MATAQQIINKAASYIGENGRRFTGHYGWGDNTPWCALFQSYVKDSVDPSLWSSSAAVSGIVAQLTRIQDWEARPGDIVAFNWDSRTDLGWMDHVGLVEWASIDKNLNGYFGTIEGNYGDNNLSSKVARVTRNNQGDYFTAFFRPNYSNPAPKPTGWDGPGEEIAGDSRYTTAEAVAAKKGNTGKLMAADPDKWADLASGMWVAGHLNANILYDREDFYLSDGTGGIYIAADNRFGTNRYTLDFWEKCKGLEPGDTCFVVPAWSFADMAACAWVSYTKGIPVILYEDHKNYWNMISRFAHVIAVGDTVPECGETERISGATRNDVAAALAERFADTWGQPMVVTGTKPYDAIAAAQWVGNDCLVFAEGDAAQKAFAKHKGEITDIYWVGGENSIPYETRHALAKAAGLE